MGCFDNILSVNGGCDDPSAIAVYDLIDIGIDIGLLDKVVGLDFKTGRNLANNKILFATKQVVSDVIRYFNDKLIFKSILENKRIGQPTDNYTVKSGDGTMRGIEINMYNETSYVDLYISYLNIQVNYTGNVTVEIWDLIEGVKKDDIVLPAVAGEIIEARVNKIYKSNRKQLRMALLYDSAGINSYYTTLVGGSNCNSCNSGQLYGVNRYLEARGVYTSTTTNINKNNLSGLGHTSGLSFHYSLTCNHEDWLCNYRPLIALPILYKSAGVIYDYIIYSSRRNNSEKFFDIDLITERKVEMEEMYSKSMEDLFKKISLPNDDKCFLCKRLTDTRIVLP